VYYLLFVSYLREFGVSSSSSSFLLIFQEDWTAWMKKLSVDLLRASSSPALKECVALADYYPIVRELFNSAFLSCWNELNELQKV
jgi:FKBP12-rapamycin complex-associated protein